MPLNRFFFEVGPFRLYYHLIPTDNKALLDTGVDSWEHIEAFSGLYFALIDWYSSNNSHGPFLWRVTVFYSLLCQDYLRHILIQGYFLAAYLTPNISWHVFADLLSLISCFQPHLYWNLREFPLLKFAYKSQIIHMFATWYVVEVIYTI